VRPNEVDQWLALWEPMLVGQPKDVAVAHVLAGGLTPHTTHYVTGAAAPQPDVINLLIGPNGLVRTAPKRPTGRRSSAVVAWELNPLTVA